MKPALQATVALALALAAVSCLAVEAEQWNPPAGSASRASVLRQLREARASGEMDNRNETYGSVAVPTRVTRTRAEVQAEGERAVHELKPNELYVGG